MAGAAQNEEPSEEAPVEGAKKKLSGKKLVLFIVLPIVVLLAVGGGLFMAGVFGSAKPAHASETADAAKDGAEAKPADGAAAEGAPGAAAANAAIFYDLPDLLVNLNGNGKRQSFLKMSVSLQLTKASDADALKAVLPRIIDNFQVYLRELRLEDLKGSAGMYRLREELLMRVNTAAKPVKVKDVLFREILVQ